MTQCARAIVGDQAILDRCARDLPLPTCLLYFNFTLRVPASAGNVTSAGWQVTLCDPRPIWHVSSRSGVACCELLYTCYLLTYDDV